MSETRTLNVASNGRWLCAKSGERYELPEGWALLPPGDATHTRRVKAGGAHWVLQERKGRRMFSRGVCAPSARIESVRADLERERAKPEYAKRLEASRARRAEKQEEYVEDFREAVLGYLRFHPRFAELAEALADQVTEHTTPVGAGTVARTKRIPIEERAASAVIAWLRHHTTGYDGMEIERIKGKRREVRRKLAKRSKQLLARFRRDEPVDPQACPLQQALKGLAPSAGPTKRAPTPKVLIPKRPASGAPLWKTGLYKP